LRHVNRVMNTGKLARFSESFTIPEIKISLRQEALLSCALVALLLIGGCNSPAKDPKNPHHAERDSRVACLNPPLPSDNTLS
jgi:hypothetical protein